MKVIRYMQQFEFFVGGGLGLGLYIVDQIARGHGGRAQVRSTSAEGTTFTVTLPRWSTEQTAAVSPAGRADERAAGGETAAPQSPRSADDARQSMVMVVDDDDDIRLAVAEICQQHGFTVTTASNGAEALELLRSGVRPKLILLDLMMPVMDGETLWRICRDDPELSPIPILIVSANERSGAKLRRNGAAGFLQKPFDLDTLMETVVRLSA